MYIGETSRRLVDHSFLQRASFFNQGGGFSDAEILTLHAHKTSEGVRE